MIKNSISGFIFASALIVNGAGFAADTPTLHQVYEAAQSGRLDEAQGLIQQVLKEHPESAKAHFVNAEILAKTGHLTQAGEEISTAERLEPGLPFAKPQVVHALKARVSATHMSVAQEPTSSLKSTQGGFPWGMLILMIGAIVAITLLMRALTARSAAQANLGSYPSGAVSAGGQPSAAGGGFAPMMAPTTPGMGSGIMSSLATGAALGAGIVAGEALVHHLMDGNGNPSPAPATADIATSPNDMGGSDFGIADNSSWNDNSSMAEISGGDDWT